jgi:serine/threonine protein kinase
MEGAFLDLVNRGNSSNGGDTAASSRQGSSSSSSSFSSSSGNTVTLVLEYMDRGSLADLIIAAKVKKDSEASSTMIPEYAIAAIAYQILWGLSYLHYEGVLHRRYQAGECTGIIIGTCEACRLWYSFQTETITTTVG